MKTYDKFNIICHKIQTICGYLPDDHFEFINFLIFKFYYLKFEKICHWKKDEKIEKIGALIHVFLNLFLKL